MKKLLLVSIGFCVALLAKDLTLDGKIVSTHDAAGGGFGIETKKGVYGLCYVWDDEKTVKELSKLESSGQKVKLKGKQIGKWDLDCESISIVQIWGSNMK